MSGWCVGVQNEFPMKSTSRGMGSSALPDSNGRCWRKRGGKREHAALLACWSMLFEIRGGRNEEPPGIGKGGGAGMGGERARSPKGLHAPAPNWFPLIRRFPSPFNFGVQVRVVEIIVVSEDAEWVLGK